MLDIHGLAKELGVSESWIYYQVAQKKIPVLRLGRSLRFDSGDIQKWLETKRVGVSER